MKQTGCQVGFLVALRQDPNWVGVVVKRRLATCSVFWVAANEVHPISYDDLVILKRLDDYGA